MRTHLPQRPGTACAWNPSPSYLRGCVDRCSTTSCRVCSTPPILCRGCCRYHTPPRGNSLVQGCRHSLYKSAPLSPHCREWGSFSRSLFLTPLPPIVSNVSLPLFFFCRSSQKRELDRGSIAIAAAAVRDATTDVSESSTLKRSAAVKVALRRRGERSPGNTPIERDVLVENSIKLEEEQGDKREFISEFYLGFHRHAKLNPIVILVIKMWEEKSSIYQFTLK